MAKQLSKFYAQSGKLRWVLLSTSVESAAVRFAHLIFQETLLGQQSITANISIVDERAFVEKVQLMSDKVLISEGGYEGPKVGIFETTEVVNRWREQVKTLEGLLRKMAN